MFDFGQLPALTEFVPYLEKIVIGGIQFILIIFAVQMVQQVRLLNRFLHTAIARVWFSLSIILLLVAVIAELWFLLV